MANEALRRPVVPLALLVVALGAPAAVRGESGRIHQVAGVGLRIVFDTRWVTGSGYRPVKITVVPLVPVAADRTLSVEYSAGRTSQSGAELRVVQRIEIPENSGTVEAVVSIPPTAALDYAIRVFEDDREVAPLAVQWNSNQDVWGQTRNVFPRMLVVGDKTPASGELGEAILLDLDRNQFNVAFGGASLPNLWSVIQRLPQDLPPRWIDYSGLDLICLSASTLGDLERRQPKAFGALVDWTAAGGNLLVHDAGETWGRLGEIEGLLGLEAKDSTGSDPAARWSLPDRNQFGRSFPLLAAAAAEANPYGYNPYQRYGSAPRPVPSVQPAKPVRRPPVPDPPPFLMRRLGFGMVAALSAADPFPGNRYEWNWLLNSLGQDRWLWQQRHGASLTDRNPDYWNFLIPGVGLAPVLSFEVLITLFVLAVGPLNYYLLRRWKRLHLMVITVPACAAIVTLGLFAYALLADGLGTRLRARSATFLDQRAGRAACWARMSYYAGMAPWGGLSFPDDVMVLPFEPEPGDRDGHFRNRDLEWGAAAQRMPSGWLASRTPAQLLTVRSRASDARLVFAPGAAGMEVENALGVHVERLAVCDAQGRRFWAEDLAAGERAPMEPVEQAQALERLRTAMNRLQPSLPPGMDVQQLQRGYSRRGPYYFSGAQTSQTTARTSLLETAMAQLGGLEPGTYLALVERSPELEPGVASAREETSLHLIVGRW